MIAEEPKFRHEYKYLISAAQLPILRSRVENIMRLDSHVGKNGIYNIRSLYFDDYENRCFYENENGTDPREKFRIRIYNHSTERITLECKKKERGKNLKLSCPLTLEQILRLLDGGGIDTSEQSCPLIRKMDLQMKTRRLRPVIIVEYDRIPYVYKNGNVRVTFDLNISSSVALRDFTSETIPKRPVMPAGWHLMEVKFDEFLPDYIYNGLNLGSLQQSTFSKYYLCRKHNHN